MEYNISIKYDRANLTYRPGEIVSGTVTVVFPDPSIKRCDTALFQWRSEGIICGQNKDTNKELEKISQQLPPTLLHLSEGQLNGKDKFILAEKNTFVFKFPLEQYQDRKIIETYVGVYIAVAYEVQVEFRLLNGLLIKQTAPFFVQVPHQGVDRIKQEHNIMPRPEHFKITPDKLLANAISKSNAKFRIQGVMDTTICGFNDDFHGSLVIEECESNIRTIDLQLIRVERVENKLGKICEATEIQLIQIVEGDATRGLEIPFNMIFPKYFSCPNFTFREFGVDFEVNLIMILFDGFKVTLNFPINVIRK